MTFVLGLTGSIGMGKSTTAELFREAGCPVHDSDATVHDLYGAEAVAPVEAAFPGTARDGRIDRALLGERVIGDDAAMKRLRVRKINPVEISGGPTDPDEIIADEVVARQRAAQNKMFGDGLFDTGQSPEQIALDLEEELAEEFAEPEE